MAVKVSKVFSDPWYFLAMGCGSGLVPKMPGTAGSLLALVFYFILAQAGTWLYATVVLIALGFGVWLCDRVARDMQMKDPSSIVWDEFVGVWIALFMLPGGWYWVLAGFVLFRFFDILKPWPVNWLDENLTGGAGIMMDDVVAAIYSLIIVQVTAFGIESL
ncbi:MAG: phosphatidylglycerophosphatase A [Pseudomonadales bacterium]|jgi:phosphatidylglycerophosphatase A|nr:phosphatidylglycerophosphatase A [Gammaproteobacteria bacterium]MDP6025608.1 phosphatidylglycerophosphatase A [Pseudomonadales bacterium]MDP6317466.1 phosphatidylglycerophosphatase A [Pseudomonadales bacterium]MDP7314351.1 phosphatidylglycerophosphatase A [Pseudomonadales bacterium]MDP7575912.1 phosphatidylglycerophosphatase A [Pseudomonadales bacterium]|tara:strand:+ start:1957 stop:2439 length:483 start_codon:yes stop_codon:yes gene_type:complete